MQVKVRALNDESMHFFHRMWTKNGKNPFVGEYTAPMKSPFMSNSDWAARVCNVDVNKVSHFIKDVLIETYDKINQTIVIDVDFTGPYGGVATSDWLNNSIRFMPRIIEVTDRTKKKPRLIKRLITWDLVHRPDELSENESAALKQVTGQSKI